MTGNRVGLEKSMGCLSVHFALSDDEVRRLRDIEAEADRLDYLKEVIEEDYFTNHAELLAGGTKAWDAMHRCLDPEGLTWRGGDYPLNHLILGGELLYMGDDYIMSLKTPEQVRDIAEALPAVTEEEMRRRYFAIDPKDYQGYVCEEDFTYTWDWFQEVRHLFLKAAAEGRYVLFTVDQ